MWNVFKVNIKDTRTTLLANEPSRKLLDFEKILKNNQHLPLNWSLICTLWVIVCVGKQWVRSAGYSRKSFSKVSLTLRYTAQKMKFFIVLVYITLYKKWSFPLRISSVNVTKSAGNCGFGHINWRYPLWKTPFFCAAALSDFCRPVISGNPSLK